MTEPRDLRTRFSLRGVDLADTFNATLGKLRLTPHEYRPELVAPEDQSTGGGLKAAQRLLLVPTTQTEKPIAPIVVGAVNLVEQVADLRTYEHVDSVHRERFGVPVPLDAAEYVSFLDRAERYLLALDVVSKRVGPPDRTMPKVPAKREDGSPRVWVPWVVIGSLASALIGLIVMLFVRR